MSIQPSHERNLSVNRYFSLLAAKYQPQYRFAGSTRADWQTWRRDLFPQVKATLGREPQGVPLNPLVQARWEADGLIKERVIFDVEENLSATAYIFRPASAPGRLPAIFCAHGHGVFGKDQVMGDRNDPECAKLISLCNYDYGLQMAKAGFVTISIDWRGFGERDDRRKPNYHDKTFGRDICNIHFLRAAMLGMTMIGMNLHDTACALDYLCQQDYVDPDRIGVMGLSLGGTMATWIGLMEDRVKAVDVICYADLFACFAMRDTNFCGSQMTPGLFALCDVPDLHGLIAPKPLLVEIGTHDTCFEVSGALESFRRTQAIFHVAGLDDRLELDLFEGGHRWAANKSVPFFRKHLA